ncbi:hypothetical protein [Pseudonocardia sp. HH130629-09]|uniref:hypothetical protein n=1 Tax=Pseudonocardia sp. HH130629-09 TaxID=1641402 RepID=UPI0006CB478A|nr:hypothetical protein [Pseudonocardia sp. HH130629-09]ALE82487.1 hypothetical protein XF36_04455 [Pseudonocardia sp. HH130629-09]
MNALAHGVGTRGDLPVPAQYAALAGAVVLVATFALLGATWRTPRLHGADGGRPLPRPVASALSSAVLRGVLRAVVSALALGVVVVGFAGPAETPDNLAPWVLYVTFWVGLVPASLLLGPVWRVVNPLRALHAIVARLARVDRERGVRDLPDRVGLWPAAVSLAAFGWLELVHPDPSDPRVVAWVLTGYAVLQTGAAFVFGARWFDRGDGFEVWSELLGSLAPVGRRADDVMVLRNPLDGLEAVRPRPGLVAVVLVLIGITGFDGLSRSSLWSEAVPQSPVWGTVGLVAVLVAVVALYLAGTWRGRSAVPVTFAHTLVPIAAGYAVAHYFSLLVFDGQLPFVLVSDPFGTGADLFGTAGRAVDYTVVGVGAIAAVQLGAIVAGHVVAAVAAHERALRRFPAGVALRVQYPMLASMVMLTFGAVALVLAP